MREIPEKLRVAVKSPAGNWLVLGRLMYASFYKTVPPSKNERDPKRFQWGTTLLIPACFDLAPLREDIEAVFRSNVLPKDQATTKWKNPILSTAEDGGKLAGLAEEYPWMIRPNSKEFERKSGKRRQAPGVVDSRGVAIPEDREPSETYNGRWARLSVQDYWYPANDGKPGVAFGLENAQLLWHDDPLAGGKAAASSDFEAVDDGDLAGMEEFQ